MKKIILSMVVLLTAAQSFGRGHEKGNGGDVVVCYPQNDRGVQIVKSISQEVEKRGAGYSPFDDYSNREWFDEIVSVEFYDLWVATRPNIYGEFMELFHSNSKNFDKFFEDFIQHLVPNISIGKGLTEYRGQLTWRGYSGVTEIKDSGRSGAPSTNCLISQVAVQYDGGEIEFNERLLMKMRNSRINLLALELHEIFVRAGRIDKTVLENTFDIHTLISELLTKDQDWTTEKKKHVMYLLTKLGFYNFHIRTEIESDNGTTAVNVSPFKWDLGEYKLKIDSKAQAKEGTTENEFNLTYKKLFLNNQKIPAESKIKIMENNELESIDTYPNNEHFNVNIPVFGKHKTTSVWQGTHLKQNFTAVRLKSLRLLDGSEIVLGQFAPLYVFDDRIMFKPQDGSVVKVGENVLKFTNDNLIFYKNGVLKSGKLDHYQPAVIAGKKYFIGKEIQFYRDGRVKSTTIRDERGNYIDKVFGE